MNHFTNTHNESGDSKLLEEQKWRNIVEGLQ